MKCIDLIESDNEVLLNFKDDVSIRNAKEIYNEILDLSKKDKDFRLCFKDVDKADVSFLQIIYSLKKTMEKKGKMVICQSDMSDEFKTALELTGLGAECGLLYENEEGVANE